MDIILHLVTREEEEREQQVPLRGRRATIGRCPANAVQIHDATVSARHAVIWRSDDGEHLLEDRNSLNGTFLNGDRIRESHPIGHGDRLRFGKIEFSVIEKGKSNVAGIAIIPLKDRKKTQRQLVGINSK